MNRPFMDVMAAVEQPAVLPRALASAYFGAGHSMRMLSENKASGEAVKLRFRDKDGDEETVEAFVGDSILDVAFDNDIEIEGACGGEVACSTCHVILDKKTYDSLPPPSPEEEDMLDLALGLTETSRLGCQVIVTKEMDGITIQLPEETQSML